jgi:hypothetical protein
LSIQGTEAFGLPPIVIIRLDGEMIGKTELEGGDWEYLFFTQAMARGEHRLTVEFINDISDTQTKQDRNVFLGDLDIIEIF